MARTRPDLSKLRKRGTAAPDGAAAAAAPTTPAKGITTVVPELWDLTVRYAKQEIRDPLKGLGTSIMWGVITMTLFGMGAVLLAIGGLRWLQTETGSLFTGNLSWAPYGIVLCVAMIVLGVVGTYLTREKK